MEKTDTKHKPSVKDTIKEIKERRSADKKPKDRSRVYKKEKKGVSR